MTGGSRCLLCGEGARREGHEVRLHALGFGPVPRTRTLRPSTAQKWEISKPQPEKQTLHLIGPSAWRVADAENLGRLSPSTAWGVGPVSSAERLYRGLGPTSPGLEGREDGGASRGGISFLWHLSKLPLCSQPAAHRERPRVPADAKPSRGCPAFFPEPGKRLPHPF